MSTFKPYQIIGPRDLTSYPIGPTAYIRILYTHEIEKNNLSGKITSKAHTRIFPEIDHIATHRLRVTTKDTSSVKFINDKPVTPPNPRHPQGFYRCTHDDLIAENLLAQRIGKELLNPDITTIAWHLYGPTTTATQYNMLLDLSPSARAKLVADPALITCARLIRKREAYKAAGKSKEANNRQQINRTRTLSVDRLEAIADTGVQALSRNMREDVLRSYANIPPNVAAIIENTIHDRITKTFLYTETPDTQRFDDLVRQIAQHLHDHPGAFDNMAPWVISHKAQGILNGQNQHDIMASLCSDLIATIMTNQGYQPTCLTDGTKSEIDAAKKRMNEIIRAVPDIIDARPELLAGNELVSIAERLVTLLLLADWQANQKQRIPDIQLHPIMHWTAMETVIAATSEKATAEAFGLQPAEMIAHWTTINQWLERTSRQYRHTQHLGPGQRMNLQDECRQLVALIATQGVSSIRKLLSQDKPQTHQNAIPRPREWSMEDRNLFTTNLLKLVSEQPKKDHIARHYAALASADPNITNTETWTASVRRMLKHTKLTIPAITSLTGYAENIYRRLPTPPSTHLIVLQLKQDDHWPKPHPNQTEALEKLKAMLHDIRIQAKTMARAGCHPLIIPNTRTAIWSLLDTGKLPWKIIEQPSSPYENSTQWTFLSNSQSISLHVTNPPQNRRQNPAWHDEPIAKPGTRNRLSLQQQMAHITQEMDRIEQQLALEPAALEDIEQDIMVYAAIDQLLKPGDSNKTSSRTKTWIESLAEAALADISGPRRAIHTSILVDTGNDHYHLIANGAVAAMGDPYMRHQNTMKRMTPTALMDIIQQQSNQS